MINGTFCVCVYLGDYHYYIQRKCDFFKIKSRYYEIGDNISLLINLIKRFTK